MAAAAAADVPPFGPPLGQVSALLFEKESVVRLGYLRCDAFDLHEGATVLCLRETPVDPSALLLLATLLKHNTTCVEVDLSACGVDRAGAAALAAALEFNRALTALRVSWNPLIDDEAKAQLLAAKAKWRPSLSLVLG